MCQGALYWGMRSGPPYSNKVTNLCNVQPFSIQPWSTRLLLWKCVELKLQLLKLWMRIQRSFFSRGMTSSWCCRDAHFQQKKATPMSQGCHLEPSLGTTTTSQSRWCHSLWKKRKSWGSGWKRAHVRMGGVKERKQRGKKEREEVMSCFQRSRSSVFVQTLQSVERHCG